MPWELIIYFMNMKKKNYDVGDLTLNCGRRVDAFKLWVSWKVYGNSGLQDRVNHAFDIAQYCIKVIKNSNGVFELAHSPQSLNVCFWFVPKHLRGLPPSKDRDLVLDKITSQIRRQLQLDGKALTNFADVPNLPHFFRHITCNPGANADDIDFLFGEIIRLGDHFAKILPKL